MSSTVFLALAPCQCPACKQKVDLVVRPAVINAPCRVSHPASALTVQITPRHLRIPLALLLNCHLQTHSADSARTHGELTVAGARPGSRRQGKFQGRGQPSPQAITSPLSYVSTSACAWSCVSVSSESSWNAPLKGKVNFMGTAHDATLDTRASLSAVRADLVPGKVNIQPVNDSWSDPPDPVSRMLQISLRKMQWVFSGRCLLTRSSVTLTLTSCTLFRLRRTD